MYSPLMTSLPRVLSGASVGSASNLLPTFPTSKRLQPAGVPDQHSFIAKGQPDHMMIPCMGSPANCTCWRVNVAARSTGPAWCQPVPAWRSALFLTVAVCVCSLQVCLGCCWKPYAISLRAPLRCCSAELACKLDLAEGI